MAPGPQGSHQIPLTKTQRVVQQLLVQARECCVQRRIMNRKWPGTRALTGDDAEFYISHLRRKIYAGGPRMIRASVTLSNCPRRARNPPPQVPGHRGAPTKPSPCSLCQIIRARVGPWNGALSAGAGGSTE